METMFKRGDKVRIKTCPIFPSIEGKTGTIVRVRIAKKGEKLDGKTVEHSTSLYKVRVGKLYVPSYATEDCLEPCGKAQGVAEKRRGRTEPHTKNESV